MEKVENMLLAFQSQMKEGRNMFKKILDGQIRDGKTEGKKMPKNSVGKKSGRNVFKKTIDDQRREYIEYLQTIIERLEDTTVTE